MYLVVRADGKFWDGMGWSIKGRPFCSVGMATRSLHEEGEPALLPVEIIEADSPDVKVYETTESVKNVST